jgi:hypothetical protein
MCGKPQTLLFKHGESQIMKISAKQKALVREIDELIELFNLSHEKVIHNYNDELLSARLEHIKNQLVRSEVIMAYTIVDEFLSCRIAIYQFGKSKTFIQLWKTKKFKNFNYYVLEELSTLAKLKFAKEIKIIPTSIVSDIERLNSLRNALAHSYFPENLKRSRTLWKEQDIFKLEGAKRFCEDMQKINDHFFPEFPHAVKSKEKTPNPVLKRAQKRAAP